MILDSTRQLWSFYSDSAFSFHPDSGLQAVTGYLLFDQTALLAKQFQDTNESEMQLTNREQESYTEKQILRQSISSWIWLFPLLILVVVGCWFLRRFSWPIRI